MGAVYYKSRAEAGQKAATALLAKTATLHRLSLSTDAVVTAAQIAVMLKCPPFIIAPKYLGPGGIGVGSVDLCRGDFSATRGGASFGEYITKNFVRI